MFPDLVICRTTYLEEINSITTGGTSPQTRQSVYLKLEAEGNLSCRITADANEFLDLHALSVIPPSICLYPNFLSFQYITYQPLTVTESIYNGLHDWKERKAN